VWRRPSHAGKSRYRGYKWPACSPNRPRNQSTAGTEKARQRSWNNYSIFPELQCLSNRVPFHWDAIPSIQTNRSNYVSVIANRLCLSVHPPNRSYRCIHMPVQSYLPTYLMYLIYEFVSVLSCHACLYTCHLCICYGYPGLDTKVHQAANCTGKVPYKHMGTQCSSP
jgi:hypothetical protein